MKQIRNVLAVVLSIVFVIVSVTPVVALNARAEEARKNPDEAQVRVETKKTEIAAKLSEKQLEICEKKQPQVKERISRLSSQGAKQLEVFSKIADRIQAFKEMKNYEVINYDSLVSEVDEARLTAQNAVSLAHTSGQEFNCSSDSPRGTALSFQENLRLQIDALKAYKTAIKDLLVAVKSSQPAQINTQEGSDE